MVWRGVLRECHLPAHLADHRRHAGDGRAVHDRGRNVSRRLINLPTPKLTIFFFAFLAAGDELRPGQLAVTART